MSNGGAGSPCGMVPSSRRWWAVAPSAHSCGGIRSECSAEEGCLSGDAPKSPPAGPNCVYKGRHLRPALPIVAVVLEAAPRRGGAASPCRPPPAPAEDYTQRPRSKCASTGARLQGSPLAPLVAALHLAALVKDRARLVSRSNLDLHEKGSAVLALWTGH